VGVAVPAARLDEFAALVLGFPASVVREVPAPPTLSVTIAVVVLAPLPVVMEVLMSVDFEL
jgi:hypothetical protein